MYKNHTLPRGSHGVDVRNRPIADVRLEATKKQYQRRMLYWQVRLTASRVGETSLQVVHVELNGQITAALFAAFVKCQTKAYLLASEEPTRDSYFAEMATRVSSTYKNIASRQPPVDSGRSAFCSFSQFLRDRDCNIVNYHVDCETAVYNLRSSKRPSYRKRLLSGDTIPVVFVPWEKPNASDNLLVCFGALALAQILGKLPTSGALIYGDGYRRKIVNIESHVTRTRQIIDAIEATLRETKPPALWS